MDGKDTGQMKLRLPVQMKQQLQARAEANNRTLNAEILNCLTTILRKEQQKPLNAKPS